MTSQGGTELFELWRCRNLWVIMDSDLNFNCYIKSVISAAFYRLKTMSNIKGKRSNPDLERLLLHLSQYIQNTAARVMTRTRKFFTHVSCGSGLWLLWLRE
ncbi:hypothetical protein NQD34_012366 [Periophthalmus magnuspinnatus]|nr:hypothetical protein NQD34_012366 [Periophthalmus magnuspinnatus]